MKNYKMLIPFGIAILAVGGILIGTSGLTTVSTANKLSDGSMFLGHLELVAKDSNGDIKAYRQTDNIVTNVAKNCAAIRIFGAMGGANATQGTACGGATNTFNYIGIGIGTAAESASDTGLTNANSVSRLQDTTKGLINATGNPYVTLQQTFTPGAMTIAEAGVFDAGGSSGGHMFAHKTFTGIGLGATDTLTVTWRITLA